MTTYERLLKGGWKEVPGPNEPNNDHHNDGRCYVFVMTFGGKFHARIEATNIRDTCLEVVRDTLKEAVDACIASRHFAH